MTFKRGDLVRLANGSEMIVTDVVPSRPANPYLGVKPRGNGAQYKFGPKHCPTKIGQVEEDHPALVALARRSAALLPNQQAIINRLLDVVESGDLASAQKLAPKVRQLTIG